MQSASRAGAGSARQQAEAQWDFLTDSTTDTRTGTPLCYSTNAPQRAGTCDLAVNPYYDPLLVANVPSCGTQLAATAARDIATFWK